MQFWLSDDAKDDFVIAFSENTIYKGNPAKNDLQKAIEELHSGSIPAKGFKGFPLSYISEIKMTEGRFYIQLLMGKDSYENLAIADEEKREKIFSFFRNQFPLAKYTDEKPSMLKAGKKPLIAGIVILALFYWTMYYAVQIESGNEYDIKNGHYGSMAGIVLWIALMGVRTTWLIFGALFCIAAGSFYLKTRKPRVIKTIHLR